MTSKEIRDIVRSEIRSHVLDKHDESKIKRDIKSEIEKEFKSLSKDFLTKKEIKDMIKDTMLKYHKWMWEKKGNWINQI